MLKRTSFGLAFTLALVLAALAAPTANATTFCVPTFTPTCPDNGTNVAQADLETAMITNGFDGTADTVRVAAGTFTDSLSFQPSGSDRLTVIGAGPTTILTSSGACNCYVALLSNRATTLRDLQVRVPANFPDNQGSGVYLAGGVLDRVTVNSANLRGDGVVTGGTGNLINASLFQGVNGGSIGTAIRADGNSTAGASDTRILGADYGIDVQESSNVTATRMRMTTGNAGVYVGAGHGTITNSVLRSTNNYALETQVFSGSEDATLDADFVTMIGPGASSTDAALASFGQNGQGFASLNVGNSIATGYQDGYELDPGIGAGAEIVIDWSNIENDGTAPGEPPRYNDSFFADPQLTATGSIRRTSPSVDAAEPNSTVKADILKAKRPQDGNSDGGAQSDQGAFELANVAPQTRITSGPGSKLAQGKARFTFASNEPNPRFRCSIDGKAYAGCTSPRVYLDLKPGNHVFRVYTIDGFGLKDPTPAQKAFNVPG